MQDQDISMIAVDDIWIFIWMQTFGHQEEWKDKTWWSRQSEEKELVRKLPTFRLARTDTTVYKSKDWELPVAG